MFVRFRNFARDLTGRNDRQLIDELVGQLDATQDALVLARKVVSGEVASGFARKQMIEVEHRGDEHRRNLIVKLAATLAPPLDREDLSRLSRSVDDVLDNLRDLVREFDLFENEREPLLDDLLEGVGIGVAALHDAVAAIVEQPEDARVQALSVKKNDIRPNYQQALATLLGSTTQVTSHTLKRRELLRRVDVIGLRLGEAADALTDGAIKRSH